MFCHHFTRSFLCNAWEAPKNLHHRRCGQRWQCTDDSDGRWEYQRNRCVWALWVNTVLWRDCLVVYSFLRWWLFILEWMAVSWSVSKSHAFSNLWLIFYFSVGSTHSQLSAHSSPEKDSPSKNVNARHSIRYAVQHGLLTTNEDDYIEGESCVELHCIALFCCVWNDDFHWPNFVFMTKFRIKCTGCEH